MTRPLALKQGQSPTNKIGPTARSFT